MTARRPPFRRIGVYCGSSDRVGEAFFALARRTGRMLAERGVTIVYGGGRVGLMGAVADAALAAGGEVIGVIPRKLMALEKGHPGLTERFIVDGMHARKSLMAHLSDAVIALPGGWGTLEELFEIATQNQLNYLDKPFGIVNVDGYYDGLLAFLDHAARAGFVRPHQAEMLQVHTDPGALLDVLQTVRIPEITTSSL